MKRISTLKNLTTLLLTTLTLCTQAQWETPKAYYNFNESSGTMVADSSGNNYNGTADCADCWETDGKFMGAYRFKSSQRIDLPAKDIALSTQEGTVAFWLRLPASSISDINCIWWAGESDGDMFGPQNEMHINSEFYEKDIWKGGEMVFVVYSDKNYFMYSDPWKGTTPAVPPSEKVITVADDQWHHIACTWKVGGNMAMYIDGEPIWVDMAYTPTKTWDCNKMTLGVANQRNNRRLNGSLDEFKIYDKELSSSDIEAIYSYVPGDKITNISNISQINNVELFPNPAVQNIYFYNSMQINEIEVYDLTGKKHLAKQVSNTKDKVEININSLSTGLYFIRAMENNKIKAVGKFYKK